MSKSGRKMTARQFFAVAVNGLGKGAVAKTLAVNTRTVARWVADPLTTAPESQSASQLERLRRLFEQMDEVGLGYACAGAVRYLQAGFDLGTDALDILSPRPTILEEEHGDYKALAEYQNAIDTGRSPEEVLHCEDLLIAEIKRTTARYIQDQKAEAGEENHNG